MSFPRKSATLPRQRPMASGSSSITICPPDVLLFLHADARLPARAREAIERALADPDIAAGNFKLVFTPARPWARFYAWGNDVRRLAFRVYYGDSGLFMRRDVYERLGGFPQLPLLEDYEFARRLERCYRTAYLRDVEITVSARRFEDAPLRTLALWATIHSLYFLGVPALVLARMYRKPG